MLSTSEAYNEFLKTCKVTENDPHFAAIFGMVMNQLS
jgi:hypothetical protein